MLIKTMSKVPFMSLITDSWLRELNCGCSGEGSTGMREWAMLFSPPLCLRSACSFMLQ